MSETVVGDMVDPVLKAERLCKRFGGVVASDNVDFSLERGEMRCVIGPNGAGKSTFFALLCGILPPDSGRVVLKGRDVTHLPAFLRVRMGLGLTFQTNRAFHALTVAENLETARRASARGAADDAHFRAAYGAFDLAASSHLPARELPHHQLQWLEICMALRRGPDVLLLDEPTAGMSPGETMYTADVLKSLSRDGLALIVVEHDVAFVRKVAETVTVLHQGAVFAEGPVEMVTQREDVRQIYLGRAREAAA
ncbi:MAG TPA: ABC transporter ATP-binding protein [Acetobacteraceae bacterium]|nr:ABC transporter ATP-binding protein [Acetobacteraceae bacterium]